MFSNIFLILVSFTFSLNAFAQASTPSGSTPPANGFLMQLPVMLALFALMYFVLIRPQRKQQQQLQQLQASISRGDEVILSNGLFGTIVGLNDKVASIEISDGVEVKVIRSQILSLAKNILNPESK